MMEHCTELQTQAPMRRQQGVASHVRRISEAEDEMRQERKDGFARRALYPPDRDATQANTDIMRVAGQTPTPRQVAVW